MADERGAFDGGQPGEWTPSAGPAPGAGWAPIGGTQARAYSPYQHGGTSPPFQGSGALPAHILYPASQLDLELLLILVTTYTQHIV